MGTHGRECMRADGVAKHAFTSFDDAHDAALKQPGYHAYRCAHHGWHVGSNASIRPRLQTLGHALDAYGRGA